ncbi:hypothetical protein SKUN_00756 [Spiroplasma kunkelii CR2-3x]|uniref:Uncharacterized protein n=1 Tax=Spiroplasma kunkelii CR2-3x TaxID=273035 RepID=A0A0K2JGU4_SPIKU|nr:hypothetical protein [Spiroplasma kunkelii]ALA97647.1 hypothetical protein SKUN_00756 [Spiroplasma kunkelii CR2-3x]
MNIKKILSLIGATAITTSGVAPLMAMSQNNSKYEIEKFKKDYCQFCDSFNCKNKIKELEVKLENKSKEEDYDTELKEYYTYINSSNIMISPLENFCSLNGSLDKNKYSRMKEKIAKSQIFIDLVNKYSSRKCW